MSFEKYQEIIRLEDKVERADTEFSQDLWIIAERILLQRLTRTSDKGPKLNSILQVIKRISAESEHPQGSQIEHVRKRQALTIMLKMNRIYQVVFLSLWSCWNEWILRKCTD